MNINNILIILLSLLSFYIIYLVKKKTNKFSYATLTALGLGLIIGSLFKENINFLETIGKGYMSLIKMIVIPLVALSLTTSIIRLKNLDTLKSIGLKAITILLGTTGIAAFIGITVANLFNLGSGLAFTTVENFQPREVPTFSQVLLDMIPANPFASFAEGKIIQVIVFSLFIAIALVILENKKPEKIKGFKDILLGAHEVIMTITSFVLKLIPFGVFALISTAISKNGLDTLKSLSFVIIAVYLASILQILLVHTPLVAFLGKMNPLRFFKAIFPAQTVAFTGQSSYGTLPVTIKNLTENANVSEEVASFVASLGATVGMNACGGLYPAVVAIFVANVFNIDLSFYQYILIIITTIVSSIGIAGVPGAATMSTTVILTTLGLPIEGMAMVIAVDSIIDMMRTATNVTGAAVTALVVDRSEKIKQ